MSQMTSPPEPDWVGSMDRHCERESDRKIVTPVMLKLIEEMRQGPPADAWHREDDPDASLRWLSSKVDALIKDYDTNESVEFDCTFDGEVEAMTYGVTIYWTCPSCGYEHEQDATQEFEPDPDDERGMREDWIGDQP
jgi:hypothetical protein